VGSRDTEVASPGLEAVASSQRPSGTPSQSRASDASKPPPVAAKPRVRSAGQ